MSGNLSKIYICKKKGSPRETLDSGILEKDFGLVGDCHSGTGDSSKQLVVLLSRDRKDIEENYSNKGICTKRFQENILIDGINIEDLSVGDEVSIGESNIELTSIGKRCLAECDLVKEQNICPLKEGAIFARVTKSGEININDVVEILNDI